MLELGKFSTLANSDHSTLVPLWASTMVDSSTMATRHFEYLHHSVENVVHPDWTVPRSIVIVGSGVFGLSTALALAEHPSFKDSSDNSHRPAPFPLSHSRQRKFSPATSLRSLTRKPNAERQLAHRPRRLRLAALLGPRGRRARALADGRPRAVPRDGPRADRRVGRARVPARELRQRDCCCRRRRPSPDPASPKAGGPRDAAGTAGPGDAAVTAGPRWPRTPADVAPRQRRRPPPRRRPGTPTRDAGVGRRRARAAPAAGPRPRRPGRASGSPSARARRQGWSAAGAAGGGGSRAWCSRERRRGGGRVRRRRRRRRVRRRAGRSGAAALCRAARRSSAPT